MPPRNSHSCEPQDTGKLPDETKQTLSRYYCDCVTLVEKQPGAQDARDNLASLWGNQLSPTRSTSSSEHSVPAIPLRDPSATTSPQTKSPSFFESIYSEHVTWIFGFDENRQETPNTSILSEANFESPKTATSQTDTGDLTVKPNNSENPKLCSAPKKGNLTLHFVNYLKTNNIPLLCFCREIGYQFVNLCFVCARESLNFWSLFELIFKTYLLFINGSCSNLFNFFFENAI